MANNVNETQSLWTRVEPSMSQDMHISPNRCTDRTTCAGMLKGASLH